MSSRRLRVSVALACLSLTPFALAADDFVYTVTTTSGPPGRFFVRGDDVVSVTDQVIVGFDQGAPFANRAVVANLNYAGVPDALRLTLNATRTQATLAYPRSGGVQNFSSFGASLSSSRYVIDNAVFFAITDPDSSNWERLQKEVNRQSFVMPADGNPSSATNFLADATFNKYGLVRDREPTGGGSILYDTPPGPLAWFDLGGGSIETAGFSGYDIRFSINAGGDFNSRIGWSASVPFQYRNIEGADSYTTAFEFGLPVSILRQRPGPGVAWTLTPFIEFGTSDSQKLGSTVFLFSPGIASRLVIRMPYGWSVCWGSQYSAYIDLGEDQRWDWYGYPITTFNGDMSQQLVKNALQVIKRLDPDVSVQASLTYTTTLANAAVDQFFTPAIGVNWRLSSQVAMRLEYAADLANHYTAQRGRLAIDVRF